jgi:NitT/TauT family transport system ATP-binding protein
VRVARKAFRSASGAPVPVLKDVAFDLPGGTVTALVGPSGCGKTTTLRILLGLDRDFAGEISPDLSGLRIGAVFQEPRLLPWRTVEANVRLALPQEPDETELGRLFEAVGLADMRDRYPAELSLGMARRAALARAFAVRPDVLLLDEPFVSLDEATARRLRTLLIDLWAADPMTVLIVTHNIREAVQLADRIVVLSPRPATVLATVDVPLGRDRRGTADVDRALADLAHVLPL